MKTGHCPNCNKVTLHKRRIGIALLLYILFPPLIVTHLMKPFRCSICGYPTRFEEKCFGGVVKGGVKAAEDL